MFLFFDNNTCNFPTFEIKKMNFSATLDYIYNKLPCYQRIGQAAYKENLDNIIALLNYIGNPHKNVRCVHIAGTNGKGSVSHMCASIFQEAGYKTGLYTSPHLIDFRERIQINGIPISKRAVSSFIEKYKNFIENIQPSFFEITVALCFDYFASHNVDIAIIETGLGGRLDSTNIIVPVLSIITNISFDHTQLLGNTLEKIAIEKAGIIKPNIPIIIGEYQKDIEHVFIKKAQQNNSTLLYAEKICTLHSKNESTWYSHFSISIEDTILYKNLQSPLTASYQKKNIQTVCAAIHNLRNSFSKIHKKHIVKGIANTIQNTNLQGRWQIIQSKPLIVCDTAHNYAGIAETMKQLLSLNYSDIHIIWGMVNDKDVESIMNLLPHNAHYYITKPSIERGMDVQKLADFFKNNSLSYTTYHSVKKAYQTAVQRITKKSVLYIGGSTFVVADFILYLSKKERKKN
jgi:dihydrofolate synthase/folylpolyglutamate synthase